MTRKNYSTLFNFNEPARLTISELAAWRKNEEGSSLLLPPIQRSIVWSNEQIVNYWDSLLRGYPAGMMIVHRVEKGVSGASSSGRDADGTTRQANEDDFQLFDGQQRMTAVLLGLGSGQMRESRRLWVDIGIEPNKGSGLKFQLRITSTGQPFGYRLDAPNQKIALSKRQDKWKSWKALPRDEEKKVTPQQAFLDVKGTDIIDSSCAIAFDFVCDYFQKYGLDATITRLSQENGADQGIVKNFVVALERALASNVILQQMGAEIVSNQDEYIRFFARLGQGGTRLSDDELTYSIIKQQYPEIHDRMREIMHGQAGRLASEVDLVLAALRVAKTLTPWDKAKEWEVISRPSPSFVSQLKDQEREAVRLKFLEMVGCQNHTSALEMALTTVRIILSYDAGTHPEGLPAILLAGLPRELVDVLLLIALKRGSSQPWTEDGCKTLRAFVLYWLLFVGDDAKAAWCVFLHAKDEKWVFSQESICDLVAEFEKDGISHFLPRQEALTKLRNEVEQVSEEDHRLRPWVERFTACDRDGERNPGEALRILSTNATLIKRALMWLQRSYIAKSFPDFDPTSDRDEDLPIDLDHIIPGNIFGFDWRSRDSRLDLKTYPFLDSENFRWGRGVVGNSLGNFRWLDASENRSRGKGAYVPLENNGDLVHNSNEWNKIIPQDTDERLWSKDDVAAFQRLIDMRTLDLYKKLLNDSGIVAILPVV